MTKLSLKYYMYVQAMTHTIVVVERQWSSCTILRTMPLSLRKGPLWLEWWWSMKFLKQWGPFETKGGPKAMQNSPLWKEEKSCLKGWELSGLKSWTEENKGKALNLLAEYHDIFALEDGEMHRGCQTQNQSDRSKTF